MHLSTIDTTSSLDEILSKQMAPLQRQLKKVFTLYKPNLSGQMNFEKEIEQLFKQSFSIPIPPLIEKRVRYEQQLIQSIHHQLRKDHLILRRTADNHNTYYLGNLEEFNHKTNEYMQNATYFETIGIIDENNSEEQKLNAIIKSIDSSLQELQRKKRIPQEYLIKILVSKRTNIKLPYLYFLPETHVVCIQIFFLSRGRLLLSIIYYRMVI